MPNVNCRRITRKAGKLQMEFPDEAFLVANNLTYAGFRVWMFLMNQPEDVEIAMTYSLLGEYHIDSTTLKRGINDLVENGYLVETEKNKVYEFHSEQQMTLIVIKNLAKQF